MWVEIGETGRESRTIDLDSFGKDVVSFGRHPECDIVLYSSIVNDVHGCFYLENGKWHIKNLVEGFKSGIGILVTKDEAVIYPGFPAYIELGDRADSEFVEFSFKESTIDHLEATENKKLSHKRRNSKVGLILAIALVCVAVAFYAITIFYENKSNKFLKSEKMEAVLLGTEGEIVDRYGMVHNIEIDDESQIEVLYVEVIDSIDDRKEPFWITYEVKTNIYTELYTLKNAYAVVCVNVFDEQQVVMWNSEITSGFEFTNGPEFTARDCLNYYGCYDDFIYYDGDVASINNECNELEYIVIWDDLTTGFRKTRWVRTYYDENDKAWKLTEPKEKQYTLNTSLTKEIFEMGGTVAPKDVDEVLEFDMYTGIEE